MRGNEIIKRFAFVDEKGKKMPAKAAADFLRSVLEDKTNEYYADLVGGKIEMMSGHPKTVQPRAEMTI